MVLAFAYSNFVRTLVWVPYRYLIILTLVKTRLYDWVYLTLNWRSNSLTRKVETEVRDMKLLVQKNKRKRVWGKVKQLQKHEDQRQADLEDRKARQAEENKKKESMEGRPKPVEPTNGASSQVLAPAVPTGTPSTAPASKQTTIKWAEDPFTTQASTQTYVSRSESSNLDIESGNRSRHPRRSFLRPASTSEGVQTTPSLMGDEAWPQGMLSISIPPLPDR